MNRKTVLIVFLLILLSILTIDTLVVTSASGSTIHDVYPGELLQEAINSAQLGDVIFVHAGTYYEKVVVNNSVSLIGEDKHSTIIDGGDTGTVIRIEASNVNISGFTIRRKSWGNNPDSSIKVDSIGNNVDHNIIAGGWSGIYLRWGADNNILTGNTISNSIVGIRIDSSTNMITGNNVSNNNAGIKLTGSDNNTIVGNIVALNGYFGIKLESFSNNNTLIDNNISFNEYGIWLHRSSNNTLTANNLSNNDYNFYVYGFSSPEFINDVDTSNTVDSKPIYYLIDVANAVYDAQTNAGTIYIINGNNTTIKDLTLTKNGYGIFFWNTTNSKMENVTASNNMYGINLSNSTNNLLTGNTASNNNCGIYLRQSSDNTITENMVSNNGEYSSEYGVSLVDSGDNALFHNKFIRNRNQAYVTSGYANVWDDGYPSGGNYWSDYEERYPDAKELDGSGIWDTPYEIDENNQDNYPLYLTPVRNIDTTLSYTTIQKAIDANETLNGHTILVEAGVYYEQIAINKSLNLQAESKGNTIIDGDGSGIVISTSNIDNVTISNFTIQNGATGLSISHSNNTAVLNNNIIQNAETGLFIYHSSNVVLKSNNIANNSYNFGVTGSEHDDFIHDIDTSNTVDGKPIYYIVNQQNIEIPTDAGYVALVGCANIMISDLTLTNNIQGILFRNTIESTIMNVTITKMLSSGIWLYYSSGNSICNNKISYAQDGIYVSAMVPKSINNYIGGNVVSNCSEYALYLINAESNSVIGNTLCGQASGIWTIKLYGSYNTLYHNNIEGQVNAHPMVIGNSFDNGVEGNYWRNYDGNDTDRDGIGDTPYEIDENNQDNHPLMGMFSSFNTSLGDVYTICNSTISDFQCSYSSENQTNVIKFNVNGTEGSGFCRICIPHTILNKTYTVLVDGREPDHVNYTLYDSGTHHWIYFTYKHSIHEVIIIPEFSSMIVLPLFMIATLLAVIICERRHYV